MFVCVYKVRVSHRRVFILCSCRVISVSISVALFQIEAIMATIAFPFHVGESRLGQRVKVGCKREKWELSPVGFEL